MGALLALGVAARAAEPIVLQLKWYHQFQFAGYYAAEAKGFYKDAGLDVVIREGAPDRPPLAAVLAGNADFGVSDDDVLLSRLLGEPVVACAAIFQHSPYVILSRADSGIVKPSDLVDHAVMATEKGATQLKAMLRHEGVPLDRVKLVPHTWKISDLIEGRVDATTAYSTVEPTQMRMAGVPSSIIRTSEYGVDFYGDTLFTTEANVEKDRAKVAAFVRASQKGWEYAMQHPQEMIDLIMTKPEVQKRGLKRENLEIEAAEMRGLIMPDVIDVGHMNRARWERMQQIFLDTGLIRRRRSLDGFMFEANPPPDRRVLWSLCAILAVMMAGAGVATLWNFQLRRKVEQSTRELRHSGANLSALIENTKAAIWSVDRDYRFLAFNSHLARRVSEAFGHAPTIGLRLNAQAPTETVTVWRANYDRALSGEHFTDETVFRLPEGPRTMESSFNPIVDNGEVTGVAVFSFDITEQRRLEEELRQSQKMDAIGQLAGGVAHDFNNLLMVIQGNASLALMSELPPEEVRSIFQDILAATERASSLTGQLLAFSRRQPMQPRDLEANVMVVEVARMLERLIGEHISLETKLTFDPTPIHADAAMIEQVLLNLAVNARDAMPQGGRLTICSSVVPAAQLPEGLPPGVTAEVLVRVDVSDTGAGISAEALPHIFEPFFTTKEVGKGTGLGLATAFGIAQQHGGWISVLSEVGKGSTFSVFLPSHERVTVPATAPATASTPVPRGSETIMVVEDDPGVRAVVAHSLKNHGYVICEAVDGHSALEAWSECGCDVDLLLTDMVMPGGLTGHALAQQLLALKPSLKVIYTSGYSAEVFRGDFVLPADVAFLRKPYRAEELLGEIRRMLDA